MYLIRKESDDDKNCLAATYERKLGGLGEQFKRVKVDLRNYILSLNVNTFLPILKLIVTFLVHLFVLRKNKNSNWLTGFHLTGQIFLDPETKIKLKM